MRRRIVTAREQVEMLEPWRKEAVPSGFEVRPIDPFDVSDEADLGAGLFPRGGSDPLASLAWRHGGEVAMISTHPDHQRNGYANALFNHVKQHVEPSLHHSPHQTPEGAAWSRQAAVDDRHPDLLTSLASCGCVHTAGGRVLPQYRTAAADLANPTFSGFDDPKGWAYHKSFQPSQIAQQGARGYSSLAGLPDPHSGGIDYLSSRRTPESVRAVAQNYDSMPDHDPNALKHYDAMRNDVNSQHDFMTNRLGIKTQAVDHDPYNDVHEMLDDVNRNKTLKVLGTHVTGGHPYFDDATNDKFRAVHDFFGHAATGRSFDRHGEQAAYLAHAQMFSPQARPALATETRGQNSSLIVNGQFPQQKTALLHPQFWQGNSPMHLSRVAAAEPLSVPTEHLDPHKTYDWTDSVQSDPRLLNDVAKRGVQEPVEMETDGHLGILGDGNHRLAAAKVLGISHLPTVFTKQPTRWLSRGGGVPLHPDIQAHLAANPHLIQDLSEVDHPESWHQADTQGARMPRHILTAAEHTAVWHTAAPAPEGPVDDSDASWQQHTVQRLKDQGGHTFRNHPSEDPPSSGFQVSQTPDNLHPADSFKGHQVRDYRDQQKNMLADPSNYVGIWQQPEGVYNEISKKHPDYWDAVHDAYDRDQIALHNNSTHDDIDVAGTQYNGDPGWYMARHD